MKTGLVCSALALGVALAGCAGELAGPSPYGYAAAPYDAPSPYCAPYAYAPDAPYDYAGSTLGFGFGGERWHERDREWHRDHDHDWHRERAQDGHHAERAVPGSGATAPPSHRAPPPTHAAPAHPAPPSAGASKEKPVPPFHGSPF